MRRVAALLLVALATGCAHGPAPAPVADPTAPRPRLALLPLENLTGRADAADAFTRVLFVELVRRGGFEVAGMGEVEAAMDSLRLRNTATLVGGQLRAVGGRLSVGYVMVGSLLESSIQNTSDGPVPSIGVALELHEVASGRVVWAQMAIRSGDDRETLFGWGREENPQRLAVALATGVLSDLRVPARSSAGTGGGK